MFSIVFLKHDSLLLYFSGLACCNGGLAYEANKAIDEERLKPDFDKYNTKNLAKVEILFRFFKYHFIYSQKVTQRVQKRFGTTFETTISQVNSE